jgi:hypothetical protein
MQTSFFNELANKYLNKPMMNIKYVFLILKKDKDGKYVPAIFNVRELEKKHIKVLEKIQTIIQTILPEIYGILDKDKNETEYDLFYTHVPYGSIFHIKTEYLHTMSNVQKQAYKYLYMISLSELIYMLSISDNLKTLKLEYEIQKYMLISHNNFNAEQDAINTRKSFKNTLSSISHKSKTLTNNSLTNNSLSNKLKYTNMSDILEKLQGCKILLMFTELGYKYKFYYKDKDHNFKCITLISKLDDTIDNKFLQTHTHIFEQIKNLYLQNNKKEKIYFRNIPTLMPYKVEVESIKPITKEELKNLLRYNPILIRILKYEPNIPFNNTIDIKELFKTPLVDMSKIQLFQNLLNFKIPSPKSKKPFVIRNLLASKIYKKEYLHFIQNEIENNNYIYNHTYKNINDTLININFIDCYKNKTIQKLCIEQFLKNDNDLFQNNNIQLINKIYFNPNYCGYNFIEKYEETKSIVWIVPFHSTDNENISELLENLKQKPYKITDKKLFNLIQKLKYKMPNFLGNFLYLNNNHLPMLNELDRLFNNQFQEGFFNISSITNEQFALHMHIYPYDKIRYNHPIAILQQGSRIDKFISIKTIINFLVFNKDYYNNFESLILLHY